MVAERAQQEHDAPSKSRYQQPSEKCGNRQSCCDDRAHHARPASADSRREELRHYGVPDYDLGPEPQAHEKAQHYESRHVGSHGRGERSGPEDDEIQLVRKSPTVPVAEETSEKRAQRHSDECHRNEKTVLRQSREAGLVRRAEHARRDVDVEPLEEQSNPD